MLPRKLLTTAGRLATRGTPWTQRVPHRTTMTLYDPDKRSGYRSFIEYENWWDPYTPAEIKGKWKWLWKEFAKWRAEVREWSYGDLKEYLQHGDCRIVHDLRNKEEHDSWVTTCDSDYNQGFSKAEFHITQHQTGMFTGILNQEPVKDGHTKAAGYANIRAPLKLKSFDREDRYNWTNYTHIVIKLRGDGRTYMLNLSVRGDFDVSWADSYNYPLYTRGGPYWQTERIPFSKFFFSHKGVIQDMQDALSLDKVHHVSITCSDGIDGPFQLEIEYIAVEFDENHTESFAYELYVSRKYET